MFHLYINKASSSYICHGVGPLVDPFRSHVSRSLFKCILIITVIFVITPTYESLQYATLAIHSYALITPFSNKPTFFPLVVPRLRPLVARFPSRRYDFVPRTSSVKFLFNKVALTDILVSCHVVCPLSGRRKWPITCCRPTEIQLHPNTREYKSIEIISPWV